MGKVCEICGKGAQFGQNVSHAHNVTSRKWHLNLQSVRAVVGGANRRVNVCSRCLRSGKVTKPGPRGKPEAVQKGSGA